MWKALKVKPEFKISLSKSQRILEKSVESKIDLVILHIDLVGSTRISMILLIDKGPYSLQISNAISCACTMIKVIQRGGLNPVQNQYDYPELKIRIGIDFGKIGVFNMGWILMNWMGTQYLQDPISI